MSKAKLPAAPHLGREIGGVLLLAVSLVILLTLWGHQGGRVGDSIAEGVRWLFGVIGWVVPLALGTAGVFALLNRRFSERRAVASAAFLFLLALDAGASGVAGHAGGYVGTTVLHGLRYLIGPAGSMVALAALLVITALIITGGSLGAGLRAGGRGVRALGRAMHSGAVALYGWVFPEQDPAESPAPIRPSPQPERTASLEAEPEAETPDALAAPPPRPRVRPRPALLSGGAAYAPPGLDLLEESRVTSRPKRGRSPQERGEVLVDTLRQFGIDVRLADVSHGPTVTRFELIPPPGVKVSKIVNLSDDIALSLAATGVRIEAPIPGKSAIGIEVPNEEIATVWLRDVLETKEFREAASPLTVALGKDIAGRPIVAPLDGMPHLLVAGATGSGKSVLINVLILSLLFRSGPEQVRLLLVDPKVVELSGFNGIPHLLTPVVTDPKKASQALRWAVKEMERRYQLFAEAGVRDVTRYNLAASEADHLPYIVVVIDELADLMMVAPAEVEECIARLAQMARAAGIHLVVATQRPSVDVITGTIKANIPSRIAFSVSSQVDSRTILDAAGAEKLMGRGDMLFHPMGAAKPLRVQGALVQEAEIDQVVRAIKESAAAQEDTLEFADGEAAPTVDALPDALFEDALRLVVESRQASASMLQRRLRVGYTRAARLVDSMAERGYVGPSDGARAREVYLTPDQFERLFHEAAPSRDPSSQGGIL